jgi:uncharacterized protein (UPF0548 family)
MAELRIGRRWSQDELAERLDRIRDLPTNFRAEYSEMVPEKGWNTYFSEAVIAREPPGPPLAEGPYRRAEAAVATYQFSNPEIVVGHFDAESRLLGRRMLLEMKALRIFRYLAGVVVGAVRYEERDGVHTFGFRYDTLEGHIERGSEWFLLSKDPESGEIRFRIEAGWLPGQFPNWWSRLGFTWMGPRYQRSWHQEAHWRLFHIAHGGMSARPPVDDQGMAHAGPAVVFQRTPRHRTITRPKWHEEETIQSS